MRNFGFEVISDTADHTGDYAEIEVIAAATFTTLDGGKIKGVPTGIAFPANHRLTGMFSKIKLASGSVVAYFRS